MSWGGPCYICSHDVSAHESAVGVCRDMDCPCPGFEANFMFDQERHDIYRHTDRRLSLLRLWKERMKWPLYQRTSDLVLSYRRSPTSASGVTLKFTS